MLARNYSGGSKPPLFDFGQPAVSAVGSPFNPVFVDPKDMGIRLEATVFNPDINAPVWPVESPIFWEFGFDDKPKTEDNASVADDDKKDDEPFSLKRFLFGPDKETFAAEGFFLTAALVVVGVGVVIWKGGK